MGQGDAVLVPTPSRRGWPVDVAPRGRSVTDAPVSATRAEGLTHLDGVLLGARPNGGFQMGHAACRPDQTRLERSFADALAAGQ